jgi:hypothetical protein
MIEAVCHCGACRITLPEAPTEITDCNCSICRRYGVLWAYYQPSDVVLDMPHGTATYQRDQRTIAFHRCNACGCVTHWNAFNPARGRMGVNARLLAAELVANARIRHLDGAVTEQYID